MPLLLLVVVVVAVGAAGGGKEEAGACAGVREATRDMLQKKQIGACVGEHISASEKLLQALILRPNSPHNYMLIFLPHRPANMSSPIRHRAAAAVAHGRTLSRRGPALLHHRVQRSPSIQLLRGRLFVKHVCYAHSHTQMRSLHMQTRTKTERNSTDTLLRPRELQRRR